MFLKKALALATISLISSVSLADRLRAEDAKPGQSAVHCNFEGGGITSAARIISEDLSKKPLTVEVGYRGSSAENSTYRHVDFHNFEVSAPTAFKQGSSSWAICVTVTEK